MDLGNDLHLGLNSINLDRALKCSVALGHVIELKILDEVARVIDILELLLTLLLVLLLLFLLLLSIINVALLVVLLNRLKWDIDWIVPTERRCLILQILFHKLGPEALVGFFLLLFYNFLSLKLAPPIESSYLVNLHPLRFLLIFTLTRLSLSIHFDIQFVG